MSKRKKVWIPVSEEAMAPSLCINVTPVNGSTSEFLLKIIHPNTKKTLTERRTQAGSLDEVIGHGYEIISREFSKVKTKYYEVKLIAAPKRGKTKLRNIA